MSLPEQWTKATYSGSSNIIEPFFFEISKGNVLNINLKELRNTLKRRNTHKNMSKT